MRGFFFDSKVGSEGGEGGGGGGDWGGDLILSKLFCSLVKKFFFS
jgi:hypothetical protein